MASYANAINSHESRTEAFNYYVKALNTVNLALSTTTSACEDMTLYAILALACFEAISGSNLQRSLDAWSAHVNGMATLIRLRGSMQMRNVTGRMLYLQATLFILGDCIRSGIPIPDSLYEMLRYLDDPRWDAIPIMCRVADLRAAIVWGHLTDIRTIIKKALALDQDLASVYSVIVPTGFEYNTFATRTRPGCQLPAYLYSYRNAISANMWNTMLNGRMLCQRIISDILGREYVRNPRLEFYYAIEESRRSLRHIQMDVIASVPHCLGMTSIDTMDPWQSITMASTSHMNVNSDSNAFTYASMTAGQLPMLRIVRSYGLIFNLSLTGRLADPGSEIRDTASQVLKLMGRSLGMSLATIFGSALEENRVSSSIIADHTKADAWVLEQAAQDVLASGHLSESYAAPRIIDSSGISKQI